MRSAVLFAALTLAACTAKPTPTGDQLIPADANLMIGVDVSGVLSSEMFGLFKPMLAKDIADFAWIDEARDCGIDPITSRLTLIGGSDGVDKGVVVFTGDGLGDATKIRCIGDKLTEQRRGHPAFTLHDRAAGPPPAGESLVAMIVDQRTVVLATPGWAAPVHDLTLGKGKAAMDGPSQPQFARAERGVHVWAAGVIPPGKSVQELRAGLGAEPREVFAAVDLGAGLALRVDVGFSGADQVATVRKKVEETAPMLKMVMPMMGLDPKTAESIKLEMKGDEVHFEAAISVADALALAKKLNPEPPPPEPQRIEHPPPS